MTTLIEFFDKETKTLSVPYYFDDSLKDIPKETETIIFIREEGYDYPCFNQKVNNLPQNIICIKFCGDFNQKVDKLPPKLKELTFGNQFTQKVDKLPSTLTHLTFGYYFNQKVDNLPLTLTHLTFGYRFNKSVDNLPPNLTHLTFSCKFNKNIDKLSQTLTHLIFRNNFENEFNKSVDNLPPNLTHLYFFGFFNKSVDNLPKKITHLTFGFRFNKKIDYFPQNLTHLTFGQNFNKSLDKLPENLIYLRLGWKFQNKIIMPKTLKQLFLTCNNILINNIPSHIEQLYIYFNNKNPQTKSDKKDLKNFNQIDEETEYLQTDSEDFDSDLNEIRYKDSPRSWKDKKVENLPSTLKEIIIERTKFKENIKIPFGTKISICDFGDREL